MKRFVLSLLLGFAPGYLFGAPAVREVDVPWESLLPSAVRHSNQFAVDVPLAPAVTLAREALTADGEYRVWQQEFVVPEAVSVSFRTTGVQLPVGSEVLLRAGERSYRHDAASFAGGVLWSRLARGDRFLVEVRVPAGSEAQVAFSVDGIQAGFRVLGGPEFSAAYYRFMAGGPDNTGRCTVNFECERAAENTNQAQATVGVIIANVAQCSGTLMRDVAGSFKPYLSTALHCWTNSDGSSGKTRAEDAAAMNFYWGAVTACGSPLASIYDASHVGHGATDRAGFGDSWLVEMASAPPLGANPYWSGFDGSDAAVGAGSFGIHHSGGKTKQYLASTYPLEKVDAGANHQWWMYFSEGDMVGGASGSGLFDPSGRHLGTATGGLTEACPYTPSAMPNNYAGYYRLGAFWTGGGSADSAARFWLDSGGAGTTTIDGAYDPSRSNPALTFAASTATATIGSWVQFDWEAQRATNCVASAAGSNWSGAVSVGPATRSVTIAGPAGIQTFNLTCFGEQSSSVARSVTVNVSAAATTTAPGSGGGGALSWPWLIALLSLAVGRSLELKTKRERGASIVSREELSA